MADSWDQLGGWDGASEARTTPRLAWLRNTEPLKSIPHTLLGQLLKPCSQAWKEHWVLRVISPGFVEENEKHADYDLPKVIHGDLRKTQLEPHSLYPKLSLSASFYYWLPFAVGWNPVLTTRARCVAAAAACFSFQQNTALIPGLCFKSTVTFQLHQCSHTVGCKLFNKSSSFWESRQYDQLKLENLCLQSNTKSYFPRALFCSNFTGTPFPETHFMQNHLKPWLTPQLSLTKCFTPLKMLPEAFSVRRV